MPPFIVPAGGIPRQPPNTTVVQIAFKRALDYPWVLANSVAQRQIFSLLPLGLADGMAKDFENLIIQSLQAQNVAKDPPYKATVANVWIPSGQVELLSSMVGESDSILYQNNNGGIKKLMSLMNSSFPLNSGSILSPIPTTSQIAPSTSGLSLGAKIAFAVVVPIVAITLLVFSLFFCGRRRKTSQNKRKRVQKLDNWNWQLRHQDLNCKSETMITSYQQKGQGRSCRVTREGGRN